jgi:hypothetical protein
VQEFHEPIEMIGHFRTGEILPCRFRWKNRVYHISRVSSCWESREGVYRRYHYVVRTRDEDVYEIHLELENMTWMLDYDYSQGA